MAQWDRFRAMAAFGSFGLSGTNAAVAAYWLSLWDGDRPPSRNAFNPARVRELLPAIALMQVLETNDAICRLSGRFIDLAFGAPMRGVNVLTLVEGEQRKLRSERLRAVVDGRVGFSRTRYKSPDHEVAIAETIQLPFFGVMEDGSRQYLTHTTWRPSTFDFHANERTPYSGLPDEYVALSIARLTSTIHRDDPDGSRQSVLR